MDRVQAAYNGFVNPTPKGKEPKVPDKPAPPPNKPDLDALTKALESISLTTSATANEPFKQLFSRERAPVNFDSKTPLVRERQPTATTDSKKKPQAKQKKDRQDDGGGGDRDEDDEEELLTPLILHTREYMPWRTPQFSVLDQIVGDHFDFDPDHTTARERKYGLMNTAIPVGNIGCVIIDIVSFFPYANYRPQINSRGISVDASPSPHHRRTAFVDRVLIDELKMNLIMQAREAYPSATAIAYYWTESGSPEWSAVTENDSRQLAEIDLNDPEIALNIGDRTIPYAFNTTEEEDSFSIYTLVGDVFPLLPIDEQVRAAVGPTSAYNLINMLDDQILRPTVVVSLDPAMFFRLVTTNHSHRNLYFSTNNRLATHTNLLNTYNILAAREWIDATIRSRSLWHACCMLAGSAPHAVPAIVSEYREALSHIRSFAALNRESFLSGTTVEIFTAVVAAIADRRLKLPSIVMDAKRQAKDSASLKHAIELVVTTIRPATKSGANPEPLNTYITKLKLPTEKIHDTIKQMALIYSAAGIASARTRSRLVAAMVRHTENLLGLASTQFQIFE